MYASITQLFNLFHRDGHSYTSILYFAYCTNTYKGSHKNRI